MQNSHASIPRTKFSALKLSGTALLWVGLAALMYAPASEGGTLSIIVAIAGFLSFASGFLMFADGLKGELIEEIRNKG